MKEIVKNDYYEISVDKSKNRLYMKIIGFWAKVDNVKSWPDDIGKATKELSQGFTVLADLRLMKTPPSEVGMIHVKAQEILVKAGLDRTAEVLSDAIVKSLTNRLSKTSDMKKREFSSIEEAEQWLNSVLTTVN